MYDGGGVKLAMGPDFIIRFLFCPRGVSDRKQITGVIRARKYPNQLLKKEKIRRLRFTIGHGFLSLLANYSRYGQCWRPLKPDSFLSLPFHTLDAHCRFQLSQYRWPLLMDAAPPTDRVELGREFSWSRDEYEEREASLLDSRDLLGG